MKSVTQHGGTPAAPPTEPRPSESQQRLASIRPSESRLRERPRSPREPAPRSASARRAARGDAEEPRTGVVRRVDTDGWRCLEWGQPRDERMRRSRPAEASSSKVTIVQLSIEGELLRQNGPDGWLPEAGEFMQRMSTLLARSLGFGSCRSLCLKNDGAVLAISTVGGSKVVAVSGPTRSMINVLRRVGLE